jgi:hypothetical protein
MDVAGFREFLTAFARSSRTPRAPAVLGDAISFWHAGAEDNMGWRDESIIPRYNDAGVQRFAFHMPAAMPAIGATPAIGGPRIIRPRASTRDAVSWLGESAGRRLVRGQVEVAETLRLDT